MSRQPVLCKSENLSTSRVSLSSSVSGLVETPFDIILIKQARLAEPTTFIFAFEAEGWVDRLKRPILCNAG